MVVTSKTGLLASPTKKLIKYQQPGPIQLKVVAKSAPYVLKPFAGLYNPYPYGCSLLCNHPADNEAKELLKRAKDTWANEGKNLLLADEVDTIRATLDQLQVKITDYGTNGLYNNNNNSNLPIGSVPEELFRSTATSQMPRLIVLVVVMRGDMSYIHGLYVYCPSDKMLKNKTPFQWKGKIVTEKQYNRCLKQVEGGKMRKKINISSESNSKESQCIIEGRQIVVLKVMAQHMYCTSCKQILALDNIEKEDRKGLGSMFSIRCCNCLLLNLVPSGKQHPDLSKQTKPLFDINSKAALVSLHAGLGFTSINNLLQTMNIPNMCSKTFKKCERERIYKVK